MKSKINEAIQHYYNTLSAYDGNSRDAKKADKHMEGFTDIFREAVSSKFKLGEKHSAVVSGGFLKKRWDMAYGIDNNYNNVLELKSIVLSKMGKCFSNRVEEAIGVAVDLRHVNKAIKLNYFLVVEDDNIITTKSKEAKLEKLTSFCNYLENELGLYENVCCILIKNNEAKALYSSVEDFISKWSNSQ